jgi:hypothetical protein
MPDVLYAVRPKDGTGLPLWLHCREAPGTADTLIRHAVSALARPVHAFRFDPALSQGLEALPDRHLLATERALERARFSGERLQRYVRAELPAHGLFAHIAELADELGRRRVVRNVYHQPRHRLSIGDFVLALEQFLGSSAPTTSRYGPKASTCPPLGRAGDP